MRSVLSKCISAGLVAIALSSAPFAAQPLTCVTMRTASQAALGLTVVATEIDLPAGQWDVLSVSPGNTLEQIFLVPQASSDDYLGRRVLASQIQNNLASGQWRLQGCFMAVQQYAATHGGVGPNTFADLDRARFGYCVNQVTQSPWPEDAGKPGPFVFLVPATPVTPPGALTGRGQPPIPASTSRTPLLLELRPYVDDGKHWVLFSNGLSERVPIDRALLAKYNITVTAVRKSEAVQAQKDGAVRHVVVGLLRNPAATAATVTLADAAASRRVDLRWSLAGGRSDAQLLGEWAAARARDWTPLLDYGDAAILRTWIARSKDLYGMPAPPGPTRQELMMMASGGRSTDAFGLLGGRAALRETLQLELLRQRGSTPAGSAMVPISTLKGVTVKSLPFDQLLAGKPGGRLALADYVPADRLLVYFAKPSAIFPFLEKGGDFLARTGSILTSTGYDDDLKRRYLRRLGLPEDASRKFLESGEVIELALTTPDLFFIDGTDLTVLMRMRSPDAVVAILRTLGIVDLSAQGIMEKATASGRPAYWARQGDVVSLSTSRAELDRVLALAANPAPSLGRSAEFRYLLTELPVRSETRGLVYLSDPFIRRMVGPAVKIAQLRRMRARAEMAMITGGALLYRLDGHRDTPDLAKLVSLRYVPPTISAINFRLQDDFSVISAQWGTAADLTPIGAAPMDSVTADEAAAYQAYMNEYSQYWRQYFDPIGIRIDDAPGGALEMSTFILPLVDSQLYDQLLRFVETKEHGAALRVPTIDPTPVFQLSLNLTDDAWTGISGGWSQMFSQYTGISPAIFDLLGPGIHIAIADADPIVTLGATDLLGAFGGATMGGGLGFLESFALSALTRPCKILVELQDPQRALELLRSATKAGSRLQTDGLLQFRQVQGRDAWIYTLGIPGIATIRLGLEIQNGFLVFTNLPWSQAVSVQRTEPQPFNGAAIHLAPGAVQQGLAGLFATQSETDQMAALASMGALLPLLQTISATPDDAAAAHARLFGSKPLHPGLGAWNWSNGKLESTQYGSATRWKEAVYKPEMGDFGLFNGVTKLDLNMQFESGGLRAVCRWTWKEK